MSWYWEKPLGTPHNGKAASAGKAFGTNKPHEPPAQESITWPVAKPLALLLQVIVIAMVVRVGKIDTVRTAPATPDINTCLF